MYLYQYNYVTEFAKKGFSRHIQFTKFMYIIATLGCVKVINLQVTQFRVQIT